MLRPHAILIREDGPWLDSCRNALTVLAKFAALEPVEVSLLTAACWYTRRVEVKQKNTSKRNLVITRAASSIACRALILDQSERHSTVDTLLTPTDNSFASLS
jgi:hypothetical protein